MGNRAVITFGQKHNSPAIYLHWNGGRCSVDAFLAAGRELGIRRCNGPRDESRVLDALAERVAKWFFGCDVGFTVYREAYGVTDTDNHDNGVYLLNRDMTVGGRLWKRDAEEWDAGKTAAICQRIVARAPIFND